MIRLAIRCAIVAGILAALVLALCAPVLAAVALVVGSIVLHRVTDLLDAMGLPYSHQRRIEEAEARGEAPA